MILPQFVFIYVCRQRASFSCAPPPPSSLTPPYFRISLANAPCLSVDMREREACLLATQNMPKQLKGTTNDRILIVCFQSQLAMMNTIFHYCPPNQNQSTVMTNSQTFKRSPQHCFYSPCHLVSLSRVVSDPWRQPR